MNSFHFVVFHLGNQQGNILKGIDKKNGRREGTEPTTGGPPLTRKSLPRFLAYVPAVGDFLR